jgi:hypothetical protein
VLGALRTEHHVLGVCCTTSMEIFLLGTVTPDLAAGFKDVVICGDRAYFRPGILTLFRTIYLGTDKTGSIAIVSDLSGMGARFWENIKIAILVLFISILATYPISTRLLRIESDPIVQLNDLRIPSVNANLRFLHGTNRYRRTTTAASRLV